MIGMGNERPGNRPGLRRALIGAALAACLLPALASGTIRAAAPGPAAAGGAEGVAPVIRRVLNNGLTVLVKPNSANDVVAVKLFLRMGAFYEPPQQRGVSIMMQKLLTRGTTSRDARQLDEAVESLGASIRAGLEGDDYGSVTLSTTVAGLEESLAVLLDVIQHPTFPESELVKERQMTLDRLSASGDQPTTSAYVNYLRLFYGDLPYGTTPADYARVIAGLTREDLLNWYRKVYIPNNMVLSIVGRVDPAQLLARLEKTLGGLAAGAPLRPAEPAAPHIEQDRATVLARPTQASFIILGYPAPELRSADRPAMELLHWILGGSGMGSRLFTRLRDERGLAYSVSTGYVPNEGPSNLFAFMATAPANLEAAKAGLIAEFQRLRDEPVTVAELESAKKAVRGSYLVQHESNAAQGDFLGRYELLGLGYRYDEQYPDQIDRVTAPDIQRVARQYLTHYTLSVVGPEPGKE
jgi:predicted Zn-dependent peptidase